MKKFLLSLVFLSVCTSLNAMLEEPTDTTEFSDDETLQNAAAEAIALQVIEKYNTKITDLLEQQELCSEDSTPDIKENAFQTIEHYLKNLPTALIYDAVLCSLVNALQRPDIISDHLIFLYNRHRVAAGRPMPLFTNYFKNFCHSAQLTLWKSLIEHDDVPKSLLFHIVDTVDDEVLYDIARITADSTFLDFSHSDERTSPVLPAISKRIQKRIQAFIDNTSAEALSAATHFSQTVKDFVDAMLDEYSAQGFINTAAPVNLQEDILRYYIGEIATQSYEAAMLAVRFIPVYCAHISASYDMLTRCATLYQQTYPFIDQLMDTAAEFFSPHTIIYNTLHIERNNCAAEYLLPLIATDPDEVRRVIAETERKHIYILMENLGSGAQLYTDDEKTIFVEQLIEYFMPSQNDSDDFKGFFTSMLQTITVLFQDTPRHLTVFMQPHLLKIANESKLRKITKIMNNVIKVGPQPLVG